MKTIAAYLAGFFTALALTAGAAVTTITTTAPDDVRIVAAFGRGLLGLGRDATQAEVKGALVTYTKGVVFNYEAELAKASATAGVTQINPS